jgi:hypothetical protein
MVAALRGDVRLGYGSGTNRPSQWSLWITAGVWLSSEVAPSSPSTIPSPVLFAEKLARNLLRDYSSSSPLACWILPTRRPCGPCGDSTLNSLPSTVFSRVSGSRIANVPRPVPYEVALFTKISTFVSSTPVRRGSSAVIGPLSVSLSSEWGPFALTRSPELALDDRQ